jgi:glutamine amidotransferase
MCRLLGYLGAVCTLADLLQAPTHSLIEQSYQPREMTAGLINADGFGIAWYHPQRHTDPFIYRNLLPIWNDSNLPHLCRYVESHCVLASVRSATAGLGVDLSNCQPYAYDGWVFAHNGYIENFRRSLYRPLSDLLADEFYQSVQGTTDSEHIFALLLQYLRQYDPVRALQRTLQKVLFLAQQYGVFCSLNCIFSNGQSIYACRCSSSHPAPSLYYLPTAQGVVIASEPMGFSQVSPDCLWHRFPENSILWAVRTSTAVEVGQLSQAITDLVSQ